MTDPHLAHVQVFPVKALDPETPDTVRVSRGGALEHDREWAIVEAGSADALPGSLSTREDYVNGKREPAVHRLRTSFDPAGPALTLRRQGESPDSASRFGLPTEDPEARTDLEAWLGDFFERPVRVRRDAVGFPDRRDLAGPTVVSTATLREVASWYDPPLSLDSVRRRFRANLELGGVPAFWEDRLYGDPGEVVAFRVGDAVFEGYKPCGRCVVPTRDPDTGEATPDFRERFLERREATLPDPAERVEHAYVLAVTTRTPEEGRGTVVSVGDDVEVLGQRPE